MNASYFHHNVFLHWFNSCQFKLNRTSVLPCIFNPWEQLGISVCLKGSSSTSVNSSFASVAHFPRIAFQVFHTQEILFLWFFGMNSPWASCLFMLARFHCDWIWKLQQAEKLQVEQSQPRTSPTPATFLKPQAHPGSLELPPCEHRAPKLPSRSCYLSRCIRAWGRLETVHARFKHRSSDPSWNLSPRPFESSGPIVDWDQSFPPESSWRRRCSSFRLCGCSL